MWGGRRWSWLVKCWQGQLLAEPHPSIYTRTTTINHQRTGPTPDSIPSKLKPEPAAKVPARSWPVDAGFSDLEIHNTHTNRS